MPFALMMAVLDAKEVLENRKIEKVLLCGGYVTVPVGLAACWLKIPIVLLEQNAAVGLSNRLLFRFAKKVFCGFPCQFSMKSGKDTGKVSVIGNPIREEIFKVPPPEGLTGSSEPRPLHVLVLGGSLGAKAINEMMPDVLKRIKNPLQLIHQSGEKTFRETQELYAKAGFSEGLKLVPFLDNMAAAYAWADLVICRAGALTVSEIAAAGRAAIFIPLPIAVDDHQTKNAKYLVAQGAAKLIPQAKLTPALLAETIDDLNVHREKIVDMGTRSKALAKPGAAVMVAKEMLLV
jgi:UDP-N-acetylglucosamine--N-acetylmuramyl-(pentapeptide) pyrophosphoryl-undecaprenol N-acetylglucosamine transferase